jgi:hypothetical protein
MHCPGFHGTQVEAREHGEFASVEMRRLLITLVINRHDISVQRGSNGHCLAELSDGAKLVELCF